MENGIVATVLTLMGGAIAWLAKQLYNAPRTADYDRVVTERDTLRAAADAATQEAKRLYDAREVELRDLRAQLDDLRSGIERAERGSPRRRADDR